MKKIITITLLFVLAILLHNMMDAELVEAAGKSEKKYLILVEQAEGHWIAYDNLVHVSSEGKPMVSAEMIARALGYLYEENTNAKQFVLSKTSNVSNTYTIGKKYYTTQSGNKNSKIKTTNTAAIDINNFYYCEPSTLGKLCYYTYFSKDTIKNYNKVAGVDGVLCFSVVKNIKSPPNYKKVMTPYFQLWYKTFKDLNVKEPGKSELYGVTFTARDHFLEYYEIGDDINGERSPIYQSMADKALEYTTAYREANSINGPVAGYKLKVGISSDFAYDRETHYFMDAIVVYHRTINKEDYWEINVSDQFDSTEADLNSLKAICYFISSTPETLYNVIAYDLFEYPVVPGIPGVQCGSIGEEWLGVIGRKYGDFKISVVEYVTIHFQYDKEWIPYPGFHDNWMCWNRYYVKKAD